MVHTPAPGPLGDAVPGSVIPEATAGADAAGYQTASFKDLSKGALSWALFQGARDPYVIVITIYVFAAYFTSAVVGDGVKGQSMIGLVSTLNSVFIALTAPFLGATLDRFGARKPLLAVIVALMAPLIWALWFAKPGGEGLPILGTLWIFGLVGVLFAYAEVVHNSLLIGAAGPRLAPHASGLALAAGNFFTVLLLTFCLFAFALPGTKEAAAFPFLPSQPLFGLQHASAEPYRISGPIIASLLVIGSIPLFLFTPDVPKTRVGLMAGLKEGASSLWRTIKLMFAEKDLGIYLLSRMLFNDGMTALLIFGGIYAAGVMGWTVEMYVYGILLSMFAVVGGLLAPRLDNWIGPKKALLVEVAGSVVCVLAQIGMKPDTILYFWHWDSSNRLWEGGMFGTLPQLLYLCIGFGTAIFVTAQYASARTMLTRLAPPDKLADFFGLFALSGTVTVWLGSLLVTLFTDHFKSQQMGFIPIAGLLILGGLGLLFVKGGGKGQFRIA